jgi:hypothetical protein
MGNRGFVFAWTPTALLKPPQPAFAQGRRRGRIAAVAHSH